LSYKALLRGKNFIDQNSESIFIPLIYNSIEYFILFLGFKPSSLSPFKQELSSKSFPRRKSEKTSKKNKKE